jgi:hypothetical protein
MEIYKRVFGKKTVLFFQTSKSNRKKNIACFNRKIIWADWNPDGR